MRVLVIMECTTCKSRNYYNEKNKQNDTERLQLKKFCPKCRKATPHKETK